MIAVLARANDVEAEALVSRWAAADARLLSPADLSRRGWVHRPSVRGSVAMVDGEPVPVRELTAVVTRLLFVTEPDVGCIVAADRSYVASEMSAFLLGWLSSLPCPVVNRPSPLGLAGPNLRPEGWMALAWQVRIPVRPVKRDQDGYDIPEATGSREEVTVIGTRALGAASARARERALRLARHAGVDIMVAGFDAADPDEPLVDAHVWPDLTRPDVADALLDLLTSRAGSPG